MQELIMLAHVPTDSVNEGFIPAAAKLGHPVVLLTDHAEAHRQHFGQADLPAYPIEIVACDVFNPLAVIGAITCRTQQPAAIFSNSDHLQASTSIAAAYFDLPRKDWRTAYRVKNKAEMRASQQRSGADMLWHATVCRAERLAELIDEVPFPCIVKPREGVASLQVSLCQDRAALQSQCQRLWAEQPGYPLLLEEYIPGPLYTLETLGDGQSLQVLGGFQVELSPPPNFIELEARWGTGLPQDIEQQVVDMIHALGVGFGACHTEFVLTESGPRLIEVNYRCIGDYREFLLQETLGIPLFEHVLRLYLGESLPQIELAPNAALIRYFTASASGQLVRMPQAFARQIEDIRLSYKPLRAVGEALNLTHSNKDYLGVLRGIGADFNLLAREMERVSGSLAWEIAA
jgi:biotin carboxylase